MGIADFIILGLIAAAFVAVVLRVRRKGACADCAQGGSCPSCGSKKHGCCPAAKGVDRVADELGRGVVSHR